MIELKEAIKIIKDSVNPINKVRKIDIIKSINKVSAENIYSPMDSPPFDRSPYDGYSYNADIDYNQLNVVGVVYAGDVFDKVLNKNEAVKIMTGAKIPEGANCVIKKEDVEVMGDSIILNIRLKAYDNYIFRGEDIKKGQLIVRKNNIIEPEDIGVLASIGIDEVLVYDDLKVGILNTGTELQNLGEILEDGKIYDSNKYILQSKLLKMGIKPIISERAKDDILDLEQKITNILEDVDFLITTGGVSVGDKDLIPEAFKNIGAKELFWRVNVKPGGACYVATLGNKVLFGLSGNPHAALIVFENVLIPAVEYLTNKQKIHNIKAIYKGEFNKKSNKDRFVNGRVFTEDAKLYVELTDDNEVKARLSATLGSNCLIKVEHGTVLVDGQIVDIVLI